MAPQAIRAVSLDVLGTMVQLSPPAPRLRAELRARTGVDVAESRAAAAFSAEIAFYLEHHLEAHDLPSLERLRDRCAAVLAEALGIEGLDAAAVRPAMLASLRFVAYPDAAPALRRLRAHGLRLVAASNWDPSLPEVLHRTGLLDQLDAVIGSGAVGAAKPDPRLFAAAVEAAGAPADRVVHVGDSVANDVEGARRAGLRPLLISRSGRAPAPAGVPVLRSLAELPSVVFRDR